MVFWVGAELLALSLCNRVQSSLLVDDNAPALDRRCGICVVSRAKLVVVNNLMAVVSLVPDLDPELVDPAPAVHLPIESRSGRSHIHRFC